MVTKSNYNSQIRDLEKIQNKAVNILKFERNSPNLLFNDLEIMKFKDIVTVKNYIFVNNQTNKIPTSVKRKVNITIKKEVLRTYY